jgi:iron complex transport system ATP-binding protein
VNVPLEAQDLTAGYRSAGRVTEIVRDATAQLAPGEFACLLGINGAGKSTLMRTLAGLQPALRGSVSVAGVPFHRLSRTARARSISLVLTERSFARHLTGLDVVRLGRFPYTGWHGRLSEEDHRIVDEAIQQTACEHLAPRPVTSMSDGERQRILIARAVAQSPQVMLLDEPTAFLDVAHRVRLTALLRDLTHEAGIAVLMSTHDLELALRTADTIWLIRQSGELITAAPEDIALSGVLSEEFSDERLVFEHEAGGFRISPVATRGRLRIGSEDNVRRLWTIRALTRAGFEAEASSPGESTDVVVDGDCWRLRDGEVVRSIGDLIRRVPLLDDVPTKVGPR